MGHGGRAFGDCTGSLGKEPKTGKGMDLGDLVRSKCGKIEE